MKHSLIHWCPESIINTYLQTKSLQKIKWVYVKYLFDYLEDSLIIHVKNDHLSIIKWLVKKGIDINYRDNLALRWAVNHGFLPIVKFLIKNGANIHVYDDSLVQCASYHGYLSIVKFLVQKGANIHTNGDWALRWAHRNGHSSVVEFLIKNGAEFVEMEE